MLSDKNFGEKILDKIKSDKISPKPRWRFLLRDYVMWSVGLFALVVGGFAFAVIIFLIKNNDWDIYEHINNSLLQFTFLTLPYFWIIFLVLFIIVVNYNFKHTKKGYKYGLRYITLGTVFVSVLLGALFYRAGMGQAIDSAFTRKVPLYEELFQQRRMRWLNAEQGFLSGRIITAADQYNFSVVDLNSNEWDILAERSAIMPGVKIKADEQVRMIGKKSGDKNFIAERILPGKPHMKKWFRGRQGARSRINPRPPASPSDLPRAMEKIQEMRKQDLEKIGQKCERHDDCELPFMYAARSSCPFQVKCLEKKCAVVCPDYYNSGKEELRNEPQCSRNEDCDCAYFQSEERIDCVCVNNQCAAVAAK